MFGDKTQPKSLPVSNGRGGYMPSTKINIEWYITKDEFIEMYYSRKLTYSQITELINFESSLERFGLLLREKGWRTTKGKQKYDLNTDFFNEWNAEVAWVYGWILTDGHVRDRGRIDISLNKRDEDVLLKIKKLIGYSGPLLEKPKMEQKSLSINSQKLVEGATNLGLIAGQKSFICELPKLDDNLMSHLMRGMFEGDGWVSTNLRLGFCTHSEKLAKQVLEYLAKNNIEAGHYIRKDGLHSLYSKNIKSAANWASLMYKDSNEFIRMERKYKKILNQLEVLSERANKKSLSIINQLNQDIKDAS